MPPCRRLIKRSGLFLINRHVTCDLLNCALHVYDNFCFERETKTYDGQRGVFLIVNNGQRGVLQYVIYKLT